MTSVHAGTTAPSHDRKFPRLDLLFKRLRTRQDDQRERAVAELQAHVAILLRETSVENLQKLTEVINQGVVDLINSPDVVDKMGGVLAIDNLVDFFSDNTRLISRFTNYLRMVIPSNDSKLMHLAAKATAHVAVTNPSLTLEIVEFEMRRAFEYLQDVSTMLLSTTDSNENKRLGAVLLLRELAYQTPTLFYAFVSQFLELIWVALRDAKLSVREAAAEALSACLAIIDQRQTPSKMQWYSRVLDEADKNMKLNTTDCIHGSLLTYRELLKHAGMFMRDKYVEVCEIVLRYKDHRDALIRRTVILLIPTLAEYNTDEFVEMYLLQCMTLLTGQIKRERERERPLAFFIIGEVAVRVGRNIAPYADTIVTHIKEAFVVKTRNRKELEAALFKCISMLAEALGQTFSKHANELLDIMFACGLSDELRKALVELSKHIPPLLPSIQENLLNMLAIILSGQPYRQPGAPTVSTTNIQTGLRDLQLGSRDTGMITLALNTLATFDFKDHSLSEFVKERVLLYLDDTSPEVRKAAALTCCQLFRHDPICHQVSSHAVQIVGQVLEKLLAVGIADTDPTIRACVLSSLDEVFDRHLAQAENIRALFIALNDEVFEIRERAIAIIGRLTQHNPAHIMPSLRKTLIQLLMELQYSTVSRNKEEAAKLLGLLVAAGQRLVKPYVEPIVKVLLPRAKDPSPSVVASVFSVLSELARVGGEDLIPFLEDLMPIIMETLQDQSSTTKRDAALRTLGHLASNTGFVVDPYVKYPMLLPVLLNFLRQEQNFSIRRETMKLIGILGALDPYQQRNTVSGAIDSKTDPKSTNTDVALLMQGIGPSSEEYYPTVVITSLMKILRDPTLSLYHFYVVESVSHIFQTMGLKCVSFLPQIIPALIEIVRTCQPRTVLDFYFKQLSILVSIVKQHIRGFIRDIFNLVRDFWNSRDNVQINIISLVESIAVAMDGEFKIYLPELLPFMLQIFETDRTPGREMTLKALQALAIFGPNLEEYLHLVAPVIVNLFEKVEAPVSVRRVAILTIRQLSRRVNLAEYSARIVHALTRVLATGPVELRQVAMDTLCSFATQLGESYAIFIPTIDAIIQHQRIHHPLYNMLVNKIRNNEPLPVEPATLSTDENYTDFTPDESLPVSEIDNPRGLRVNQQLLKRAWDTTQRSTKEDWIEWMRHFSEELLKESPSQALRACAKLANVYQPLSKELFNSAFVSCWLELDRDFQNELVGALKTALASNVPEIMQQLLNLAEFMEHDEKTLGIENQALGLYATKCQAFAKALHYKELEFMGDPYQQSTVEKLIHYNQKLQMPDAANGILIYGQKHLNIELKEYWYEELGRWDVALEAYERKQQEDPNNFEAAFGRMRCLQALGEWDALSQLAQEKWPYATAEYRLNIAPLAATAAWGIGQWDRIDKYIVAMKPDTPNYAFFRAILSVHRDQFDEAAMYIDKTRNLLDTELTALLSESYNRAYNVIVRIQMLAELEEIIAYKRNAYQPERQAVTRKTWMKRLKGTQRSVEVWQRILKVRALVISPQEDMAMWIKFANLCRKNGRFSRAEKTLMNILGNDPALIEDPISTNAPPQVVYSRLKQMWASDVSRESRQATLDYLRKYANRLYQELGLSTGEGRDASLSMVWAQSESEECIRLLARCYLKQGQWQVALQDRWREDTIPDILRSYALATHFDENWYKAWHAWALANYEVIKHYENEREEAQPNMLAQHIVPAVQGFFRSIALCKKNSLQDTLRLLTLWFKHGSQQDVYHAIMEGFNTVNIDTWLQVVPQLIARIHAPNPTVRKLIHQLLCDLGRAHPQALLYSIMVASKSPNIVRKNAAISIIEKLRSYHPTLVEQALLVSQELVRVAILWHEMWHEGLEEASRLYFAEHNIEGMFSTLEPLHQLLGRGSETINEMTFIQAYGQDLQEAQDWCRRYKETMDINDLNHAWDLYYQVFRRVSKQIPQLNLLELKFVSPKLEVARDLDLAVPGTYRSGEPVVRIASFAPKLSVISSKQRPRKMTIKGMDGNQYQYLLKGREDLRLDERVMQVFELVNALLLGDVETYRRHLRIVRYSVTPLSPNSGLIGWVPYTDTMHALIREYRDTRSILLNIEHRLMLSMAPDYDNLSLLQKVEVFEYALDNTTGQDLYRVLWLKSKNSESWLERRTNYTRSLAVMSMVGYILGLGDRHPSNLMIERTTGNVVHIDFGDCFEVAMNREKFPERIPFRLTRMLVNAMEVSGIEGSFRITCEHTMRVLRENKESLMAVLEAFVYDPLLNFRVFLPNDRQRDGKGGGQKGNQARSLINGGGGAVAGVDAGGNVDHRKVQRNENELINMEFDEGKNLRAVAVLNRVSNKLTGRDFKSTVNLDVATQVDKLIQQAVSIENLCQCYIGWCAFW
ncbi:uncharacterized protein VTP21DRAFT_7725 [Calcarisporiella thermophila]|uniref:uncharacterized protein n=1 Tax=Calcarisporiella thermophila TaxID=911321 RepID=UPI00374251E2